jgi:hypothetical protein
MLHAATARPILESFLERLSGDPAAARKRSGRLSPTRRWSWLAATCGPRNPWPDSWRRSAGGSAARQEWLRFSHRSTTRGALLPVSRDRCAPCLEQLSDASGADVPDFLEAISTAGIALEAVRYCIRGSSSECGCSRGAELLAGGGAAPWDGGRGAGTGRQYAPGAGTGRNW